MIFGVGSKTADKLRNVGIQTVRDILNSQHRVIAMLNKKGQQIIDMANGIDTRSVTPYYNSEMKSLCREETFQQDTTDISQIKGFLSMFANELSMKTRTAGLYSQTITLKITYGNMKSITRSKSQRPTNSADEIYNIAVILLAGIEWKPLRKVGISLSNFSKDTFHQLSLDDMAKVNNKEKREELDERLFDLKCKYGSKIIKKAIELEAEKQK